MKHARYAFCTLLLIISTFYLFTPLAAAQQGPRETATVTSVMAPLHEGASAQTATVANLPRGTLLDDLGLDSDRVWVNVRTQDGLTGWINVVHVRRNGPYIPPADGLTINAVDGQASDWDRFTSAFSDEIGDSSGSADIAAMRSFTNSEYLYFLLELEGDVSSVELLLVDIVTLTGDVYQTYQYALPRQREGSLFFLTEEAGETRSAAGVLDVRDSAIEFRMPLLLLDSPDSLNIVGVHIQELVSGSLAASDDLIAVMPTVVTLESEAPNDAQTQNLRANLRAAPVNGRIMQVLAPETLFHVIGVNTDASWALLRLEDTTRGWVSADLIETELDLTTLPVVE